jgi:hypothetical protein
VISRAQRILFILMLVAAVTMAAILIRLRERAQDRLQAVQNSAALVEPVEAPPENITLLIPNDTDGSLLQSQRALPMPQDDSARARVLLETLIESFHDPRSTHPIAGGTDTGDANTGNPSTGIDEVFLMPVPRPAGTSPSSDKMAVVNFNTSFTESHPSGIEPETLTLLAIIGTLHANLPAITQVRFLVDGHQRDTLAGHADLTRVYLASDTSTGGAPQQ